MDVWISNASSHKSHLKDAFSASLFLNAYSLMLLNYSSLANSPLEKKLGDQNDGNLRFTSVAEKKADEDHIVFYLNWDVIAWKT